MSVDTGTALARFIGCFFFRRILAKGFHTPGILVGTLNTLGTGSIPVSIIIYLLYHKTVCKWTGLRL